jgi:hypothetical protein
MTMNADFVETIKQIIEEQGGDKEAKKALKKAVKMRLALELKNANEKERPFTKAHLAQMLHEKSHFDLTLCNKTLDTLCTALFNEQAPETVSQPQDAQELAAEPTAIKAPRRLTSKIEYILLIIIAALLAVIATGVWIKVQNIKPETLPVQEEQKVTAEQSDLEGDENE